MQNNHTLGCIIDVWSVKSSRSGASTRVIPDGCRDLIYYKHKNKSPIWRVSPLFNRTQIVKLKVNTQIHGFRLKPGTVINKATFFKCVLDTAMRPEQDLPYYYDLINDASLFEHSISESLKCLANTQSIGQAADDLGVSQRTLQRHLLNKTGQTPSYWMQLARVRKAGRFLCQNKHVNTAEVAYLFSYSDQAHLCRSIKYWFGLTPNQLKQSDDFNLQINATAYS